MTPDRRVVPQHPLDPSRRLRRAVRHDHHTGVLREAHADAAAMMQRHPCRPGCTVQERVQERPVGDRIGAVPHRLRLAVGRGDGAGIEMVAADHDRRLHLARRHHLVEGKAEPVPVAEPYPADARRQALELDPRLRHVEPVVQVHVVGQKLLHAARRSGRCPPDRRKVPPSGTARCRGRRADGCRRGRSRGSRRRRRPPPPSPSGGCCCRSRASARRPCGSRAWRGRARPSNALRPSRPRSGRFRGAKTTRRASSPSAGSRSAGRAPRSGR